MTMPPPPKKGPYEHGHLVDPYPCFEGTLGKVDPRKRLVKVTYMEYSAGTLPPPPSPPPPPYQPKSCCSPFPRSLISRRLPERLADGWSLRFGGMVLMMTLICVALFMLERSLCPAVRAHAYTLRQGMLHERVVLLVAFDRTVKRARPRYTHCQSSMALA